MLIIVPERFKSAQQSKDAENAEDTRTRGRSERDDEINQ